MKNPIMPDMRSILFDRAKGIVSQLSDLPQSALIAMAVKVGAAALGFGSQMLLARLLGADQYGVYSYYWVCIMIGGILASLGFTEASMRFIAEYRDTKQFGYTWGFINTALLLVLGLSGFVSLVGFAVLSVYSGELPEPTFLLIALTLICLPIFALQDLVEGFALAFSWTGLAHIPPYILRQFLIMAFILGFAVFAPTSPTAVTALSVAFIAVLIATAIQLALFMRRVKKVLPPAKSQTKRLYWLKTSTPMLMANGFQICLTYADILILGLFVDSTSVALYFAATRISTQVTSVQFSVTSAVAQRFSGLHATEQTSDLHALIKSATQWIFWPTLLIVVGILIVGWPFLWLFGPDFTQAYLLLPILTFGLLVRASMGSAEYCLKMLGHEKAEFAAKGAATALNIMLNFFLIPLYGIYGAAVATTLSVIAYSITIEILVRKRVGTSSFIATLR